MVFGSDVRRGRGQEASLLESEAQQIRGGRAELARWAERAVILDESDFQIPSIDAVVETVEKLKADTGCSRSFVVVDYLQLWPIPETVQRHIRSELAEDKWRVGEMKRLRDRLNGDPVVVISESRKPGGANATSWGSDLSDLMGSARLGYRADAVFLLVPLTDDELDQKAELLKKYAVKSGQELREGMKKDGKALLRLVIAKGRDGVMRDTFELVHHFRQSRMEAWRDGEDLW
jgi:hypothetical protein